MTVPPPLAGTVTSNSLTRYVAESATEECRVPLDKEECEAYRSATPAFTDGSSHGIGASTTSMSTFVDDKFLPFGCQWYVDPPRPELNRFLFNEANADGHARDLFNGHNTLTAQCTARSHWCYPAYSYRVCGNTGNWDTDQWSGGGVPLPAAAARATPAILLVVLCLLWLVSGVCKRLCSYRVAGLIIRPITEEARGTANGDKPSGENHILKPTGKTDPPVPKPLSSLPWRTQADRLGKMLV